MSLKTKKPINEQINSASRDTMWENFAYKKCYGLVWFYGISTIIGYLIPNSIHTCIVYICIYDF